jgi:biopolymer transport protein ExbB
MEQSILTLIDRGGFLMYPIIGCSILAVAIIGERVLTLRGALEGKQSFIRSLHDLVTSGFDPKSALNLCDSSPGLLPRIIRAAILNLDRPREEIREVIEGEANKLVPALHKNINILGVIAQISPLLGLLGTVIGMIDSFATMQQVAQVGQGLVGTDVVAGGIWTALITTAAGLTVAIPVYISHNFLERWADTIVGELETGASESLRVLEGGEI